MADGQTAARLGAIKGKVFRSDSGETISNAYIQLTHEKDEAHFDTRSDVQGEYSFRDLPAGHYTVSISAWFQRKDEVPSRRFLRDTTADGGDITVEWQPKSQVFMETVTLRNLSIESEQEIVRDFDLAGSKRDELTRRLNVRVPEGRADGSFIDALVQAACAFNIPMGIAWVKSASSEKSRSIEYRDETVLGIIEAIAKTEPGYEVRVVDDVVHVATKDVPDIQNFLELTIPEFSAKGVANAVKVALWWQLNQRISPDPPLGYAGDILSSSTDPMLDLQFANVTVEQILDSVALASNCKVWVVTFEGDRNLTASGFRRTQSLFSKTSIPDEGQPVWDSFPWNHWLLDLVPAHPNSN